MKTFEINKLYVQFIYGTLIDNQCTKIKLYIEKIETNKCAIIKLKC